MSRSVLVTGGAGFIGSNIVARFAEDGWDVAISDRLRTAEAGKWRNIADHPIADFVAPEDLPLWLEKHGAGLELIVHMGAVSSTMEPDADKIVQTNFVLSRNLFQWCTAAGKRLIYASSAATYGAGEAGFEDVQDWRELAKLRPLNAYGWSKAAFDIFAARQAERDAAPPQWAGLKFFNVYGPNEEHKGPMRSVVSQIWPDVASGRKVKLFRSYHPDYAHGGQLRDFVYVRDVVDVVAWLAATPAVSGIYNLGSGKARSFKDLAEAVFAAADREPEIEYIEMPRGLRERYQYFTEARMDRLRAAGFNGTGASLEDGIADYVARYLSQPDPRR